MIQDLAHLSWMLALSFAHTILCWTAFACSAVQVAIMAAIFLVAVWAARGGNAVCNFFGSINLVSGWLYWEIDYGTAATCGENALSWVIWTTAGATMA